MLMLSWRRPRPAFFKFIEQSYKFIAFLFFVAFVGFGLSIWRLGFMGASDCT